eukprot:2224729-Rhodomonas_salina.1
MSFDKHSKPKTRAKKNVDTSLNWICHSAGFQLSTAISPTFATMKRATIMSNFGDVTTLKQNPRTPPSGSG